MRAYGQVPHRGLKYYAKHQHFDAAPNPVHLADLPLRDLWLDRGEDRMGKNGWAC